MKVATIEHDGATIAVRVDNEQLTEIAGYADVGALLAAGDWQRIAGEANGATFAVEGANFVPPVTNPSKTLCIGLNYRKHILEMGRELPEYPSVFAKFAETLTGAYSEVESNPLDAAMDWEGELVLVIAKRAYRVDVAEADDYIAGYTVANDISMRTWQNRTPEWLQGKMWAGTTPVGPVVVSTDEVNLDEATLRTVVNGQTVQEESLSDLLFSPAELVAYLSQIIPLNPGDLILTGTPGGVGHARRPQMYLEAGDVVEVAISGIGEIRNAIVAPK